jgi:hypothetical protein
MEARVFRGSRRGFFLQVSQAPKNEVETERDMLLKTIGELKVTNDFLKKALQ